MERLFTSSSFRGFVSITDMDFLVRSRLAVGKGCIYLSPID
jgi:hypothetical protein